MPSSDPWGETLPTLHGRRVVLRWPRTTDASDLLEIFGDPEVTRFWSHGPFTDVEGALKLVMEIQRLFAERVLFQWAVTEHESDRVIGTCTLHRWSTQHRRAEVGFALRRSYWGCGWMKEAVSTMIDFAFGPLNLHRLEADVDPRNERSLGLLMKLGFQREGLLAERFHVGNEIQDSVLLGLLARQWRTCAGKGAFAPTAIQQEVEPHPRRP
ncbi:MAG: GNAT family N-acetyltransferase [Verrucomicrobiales bacterium]|nr:GNAT family N-acetyltransferase [Verrucomicrobiales bacterium]